MNKKYFMPFLALSALILIIGCLKILGGNEDDWLCTDGAWVKHGNPRAEMPKTPCNSANIKVTAPQVNSLVTYPLVISGEARVFENQFNYKILDSFGSVLKRGSVSVKAAAGQFGPFQIKISSLSTKDTKGSIVLFDLSAKDGAEIDKVTIPVRFK